MGSPDLPNEHEYNNSGNEAPIINYDANSSDESDHDEENIYDGYELIPVVESIDDDVDNSENEELRSLPNISNGTETTERHIWNEPTTREEKLDNINVEQIMSVMVGITLPNSAVPDWAQVIPEELWKQDLLNRISQRKENSEPQ